MKKVNPIVHKIILIVFLLILLVFTCNSLNAQKRWEVAFRPSLNFHSSDIANVNLGIGNGVDFLVAYRFQPHMFTYIGWGWNTFPEKSASGESHLKFIETGYSFGFQFRHPIANYKLQYLVGLAGIYNHIKVRDNNLDIMSDSSHGLGWESYVGVSYPFGKRFHFSPTVRFRSLSRDIEINTIKTEVVLRYYSLNAAISYSF